MIKSVHLVCPVFYLLSGPSALRLGDLWKCGLVKFNLVGSHLVKVMYFRNEGQVNKSVPTFKPLQTLCVLSPGASDKDGN